MKAKLLLVIIALTLSVEGHGQDGAFSMEWYENYLKKYLCPNATTNRCVDHISHIVAAYYIDQNISVYRSHISKRLIESKKKRDRLSDKEALSWKNELSKTEKGQESLLDWFKIERGELKDEIRRYWVKHGKLPPTDRMYVDPNVE